MFPLSQKPISLENSHLNFQQNGWMMSINLHQSVPRSLKTLLSFLWCVWGHLMVDSPIIDSIPGLGRSPGEGKVYPLQCSGLAKSWTRLSDFHFLPLLIQERFLQLCGLLPHSSSVSRGWKAMMVASKWWLLAPCLLAPLRACFVFTSVRRRPHCSSEWHIHCQ